MWNINTKAIAMKQKINNQTWYRRMSIYPVNVNETFISCVPEFIFLSQKLIIPTPPPNFFLVIFMLVQSPPPLTRKHHGYRSPNTTHPPKIHLSHPFYVPKMQMKFRNLEFKQQVITITRWLDLKSIYKL